MTPDEHTISEFFLDVGAGHRLYVQQWGNKSAATPALYFHGGPGNGVDNGDKSKFDPLKQRVYFFDQRGAGKSEYDSLLQKNTTADLVEDIEKLASREQLDKFVITGSSWGSTLALCYALAYPDRVSGMVLDGIFLGTKKEIDWLNGGSWRTFFPDIWEEYSASVPDGFSRDPSSYHFEKALNGTEEESKKAIYEYLKMELAILKLDGRYMPPDFDKFNPNGGKVEMYYLANNCFLEEGYILQRAASLTMPVCLIQGRYDLVCPPEAAHKLHKALPASRLLWTINGHLKQHEAKNIQKLLLEQLCGAA